MFNTALSMDTILHAKILVVSSWSPINVAFVLIRCMLWTNVFNTFSNVHPTYFQISMETGSQKV